MFVDVKKAHLDARCYEEWVESVDECGKPGKCSKLRRWLYGMRRAVSGWEDNYARKLTMDGIRSGGAASTHDLLPSQDASEGRRARRRFHVRWHRAGVEEDQVKNVRVV